MARADKPVESGDDLSPVTVKIGQEDDREDLEVGAGDDEPSGGSTLGSAEPMAEQQPREMQTQPRQRDPGDIAPQRQKPTKPSSWKGYIEKAVTERTKEYQTKVAALEQQLATMMGRWEALEKTGFGRQPEQQDPASQELTTISKQLNDLAVMASNADLPAEQRQALAQQFQQLSEKRERILIRTEAEKLINERLRQQQENVPSPDVVAARTVLATEFPRLEQDHAAKAEAKAYYNYLVARNGGQESLGLLREACQYIYTQKGWAPEGFRSSSGRERGIFEGAGGGGRSNGHSNGSITFGPDQLAVLKGSGVSPAEVAAQMERMKRGEY